MKSFTKIINLLAILSLNACAKMPTNFDCPIKAGVQCKRLDQVNQMIDQSEINQMNKQSEVNKESKFASKHLQKTRTKQKKAQSNKVTKTYYNSSDSDYIYASKVDVVKDSLNSETKIPKRTPEKLQRIWVAPYVDKIGNYHAASIVYTVKEPSQWLIK